MNVLLVMHRVPIPQNDGAKIRAFQILAHMGSQHKLTLACVDPDPSVEKPIEELKRYCERVSVVGLSSSTRVRQAIGSLMTSEPISFAVYRSRPLREQIKQWHAENPFDLVIGYSGCTEYYLGDLPRSVKFMDLVDLDSEKWFSYARASFPPLRWLYQSEGQKTRRREKAIGRSFDGITVTTQAELDNLLLLEPTAQCGWFSNGVDAQAFTPTDKPYLPSNLCFLGKMDYLPNIQACELIAKRVLPTLRQCQPDASFTIIGSNPTRRVRALAQQPGVTVTGFVDDVRPLARVACCMVAPLSIARGVQNKLLESMAMGVPVVTSNLAARGVDARIGTDLLVADSPDEIVDACLALINDPALRARIATAGRQRVLEVNCWQQCLRRLDEVMASLLTATDEYASERIR